MRETGNIGLVTANPLDFQTFSVATAAFLDDRMVANAINTRVGHIFFSATVTGTDSTDAYIRTEVWHQGGIGDQWYIHSVLPVTTVDGGNGTKTVNTDYYIDNFAPYIRLQIAVGTADGADAAAVPSGGNTTATLKTYFSFRGDI